MNLIFGKYIDNNSFLTKIDVRLKILMTLILIVLSFWNLNFYLYIIFFVSIILITLLGKLSLKPIGAFFKHTWLLLLILLIINSLLGDGYVLLNIVDIEFHLDGIFDTFYIIMRILVIILISNLLTSTSEPSKLTYGLEFYLTPLKIFKIEIEDIALMMSIAIRFVPTLCEEADKITKAQTSRGVDFNHGGIVKKTRAIISLIIPLFMSCFEKSEDLSEAMIVKGYGMGEKSKYKRKKHIFIDVLATILFVSFITGLFVVNGVI